MYLNSFGALSPRIRSGGEKTFREGKVFFRAGKKGPPGVPLFKRGGLSIIVSFVRSKEGIR